MKSHLGSLLQSRAYFTVWSTLNYKVAESFLISEDDFLCVVRPGVAKGANGVGNFNCVFCKHGICFMLNVNIMLDCDNESDV